jgi:hypothetical protein
MELVLNKYDYSVLTNTWDGPYGAAYTECYEFCEEHGLLVTKMGGFYLTDKGKKLVEKYENSS